MKLLRDLEELAGSGLKREKVVLTIGAFDGVTIAHQTLISRAVSKAHQLGALSVVLSFDPHPDFIVSANPSPLFYLCDPEDKVQRISALGVDILIIQPFTLEFARRSAQGFVDQLFRLADIQEIHVGQDFVFGHRAQGNLAFLTQAGLELGFGVEPMAPLEIEDEPVRSTRIRQLLAEGKVKKASSLLGRYFSLKGEVIEGNKRGRLIGFPTANMAIPANFAVPANGVYATRTSILNSQGEGKPLLSITNVGVRPTFDNGERSVETFIFDFDEDIYYQIIRVEFIQRLRDERKFSGIEGIREQLGRDVREAREVLETTFSGS